VVEKTLPEVSPARELQNSFHTHWLSLLTTASLVLLLTSPVHAAGFHNAPASAAQQTNPYASPDQPGHDAALKAGAKLYQMNCGACHGNKGKGTGNIPSLVKGPAQSAPDGEVFWYVTKGDKANGMPAWTTLSRKERWQVITYVKALGSSPAEVASMPAAEPNRSGAIKAPAPTPPFTDFRFEKPGTVRKITLADLPAPYATRSADNAPRLVARPADAWPKALDGFKVEQYATGLDNPRLIRTAPNGDFFVAESDPGDVKVFRGIGKDGKAELTATFATGLNKPFGIAFYPPGPDPQWIYIGDTDAVLRIPYHNGDVKASGPVEHIADVPPGPGHWTRDVRFSVDGKRMFVSVGSASNVDDADTTPGEKNRADVLAFNPDGSEMRVYAYGIRNCVGMLVDPGTGELWCSVNERDGLGDNLVPDYITHVQEGGFYGWPWWYMGGHQDPRHQGKHPELKDKVITPDVILHPHNASLEMTIYDGKQFPAEYQGDIFACEHGSWNRGTRVGYELIRVPRHQTGHASGEYEDFVTGFVLPDGNVWGRPVGVTVAPDGSLLVTDDGSNSIWRVSYAGK